MPEELPSGIKDLIARLLTLDPTTRIKIEDIKRHPALRIGLPEEYMLPSLLPIPNLVDPIPLALSDSQFLPALVQIGFTDTAELTAMLSANTPNMSKVFYIMLTRPFDPQKVDWGRPAERTDSVETGHPFVDPIDYQAPDFDLIDASPVIGNSSPCQHCDWLPEIQRVIYEQEQEISNICSSMPLLMTKLQLFLKSYGYLWYHIDDRTIIIKDPNVDLYMTVIGEYDERCFITLHVKMLKATSEQFEAFFESIRSLLLEDIRIVDSEQLNEANVIRALSQDVAQESNCNPM